GIRDFHVTGVQTCALPILCRAILGHGNYTGVARDTPLAKTLFAVDELCGFLVACALVRPSRSFADLEVSSVKKKLKDKAFAKGRSEERRVGKGWRTRWCAR